jgi:ornithine carbamoyltransferase
VKHFLDICDLDPSALRAILDKAAVLKAARKGWPKGRKEADAPLAGRLLAMIFERPSTRTRVSFEAGMRQLGGETLVLNAGDMQLGRGESIADTARVLSRYVDAIMLRASNHSNLAELAAHATVPVINGLTSQSHPCQVMADVQTLEERVGPLANQRVAWIGDGNNVAASWIHAVKKLGGALTLACPPELAPSREAMDVGRGANISLTTSPEAAVEGATCVITDAWVSMHDADVASRHNLLKPYQVNAALMKRAASNAIFMHCLPAHRGEEVTDAVMDGPQSAVLDEAENRLHVQKAILIHCLT